MKNRSIVNLAILILIILLTGALFSCVSDSGPYTITFDTSGGSAIESLLLEKGSALTLPKQPVKQGYTFYGWYYDKAFSFPVDAAVFKAIKDITLYARWENNENIPHEIVFTDPDFADFYTNKEDNKAIFNETVEVTISPRPGYRIAQGSITAQSDNTNSIVVNKVRNVSETIIVYSFKMPAERVEVSSGFELRDYSLSVNVLGGEGAVYLNSYTAKMQEEIVYTPVPEAGYRFSKLIVNAAELHGGIYIMQPQNITFFAYFEKIDGAEYAVNIDSPTGGSIAASRDEAQSGVFIYLSAFPDEGYRLDEFLLDGLSISDYFIMPNSEVTVSAKFLPLNPEETFAVNYQENINGSVVLEKEYYSAGETIEFQVVPDVGFILDSLFINDKYIPSLSFIMPAENVNIRAVFLPASDTQEFAITAEAVGGTILLNRTVAKKGQKVSIIAIIPDAGYRMVPESLRYNTNVFESGSYFIMPDAPVFVTADFIPAPEFTITAFENSKGYLIPSKSNAYEGELITITARAKPGYLDTEGNFSYKYFAGNTQFTPTGLSFIMPASDIILEGDFDPKPSAKRLISFSQSEGGTLSASFSSAVAGTLVHVNAAPYSGYKLNRLYYPVTVMGEIEEIPLTDSFLMPDFNIVVHAVFEKDNIIEPALQTTYNSNKHAFALAGIRVDLITGAANIASYLPNSRDAVYIDAVIYQKYNTESVIYEINDIAETARIAQDLMYYYSSAYPKTDFKTFGNIFVVSIGGSAVSDYDVIFNGTAVFEDFILYPRANGTYGALAYVGKSIYVSVPFSYNGRSVSKLEAGAFLSSSDIVKLSLGAVREVAEGAFDKLSKITTLNLSGVTKLAPLALKDCTALVRIIVDNEYNSVYYSDERGALYERLPYNTFRLIRYPAGNTETEYTIRSATYDIAPFAFYKTNLRKVSERLPRSVLYIGEYAFKDATELTDIDLSRVIEIKDGAFLGCFKLAKVSPGMLSFIGKNVFEVAGGALTIELSNTYITGSASPILISGSGNLRLVVSPDRLDTFRQTEVFKGYSKYFTANLTKANEYIIIFESNGGTYINCQRREGSVPVPPEPPIREGYTFDGWYEDEEFTVPFTFTIIYDKKVIPVFAKWIENS